MTQLVNRTAPEPEFQIEKLRREHSSASFDCGSSVLDQWLQRYAWANQQSDSAKTYVAIDADGIVAGFYSLTSASVTKQQSPERIAKGLANHPIGIVLLARLAVDVSRQGKGLGKALLFDALSRVAEASEIVGVRAVMVHAKDHAAREFYQHFNFEPSPVDPFQLLLLMKDLRESLRK